MFLVPTRKAGKQAVVARFHNRLSILLAMIFTREVFLTTGIGISTTTLNFLSSNKALLKQHQVFRLPLSCLACWHALACQLLDVGKLRGGVFSTGQSLGSVWGCDYNNVIGVLGVVSVTLPILTD